MTKRSSIFVATLVASISIAGVAFAQESAFEGFYVGGQAGYSNVDVDVSVLGIDLGDETMDGFGGGGFIGFGGTNGQIYGAIEAELGYDGAQWDESGPVSGLGIVTADIEARLTYGVGFRVGAVIDDRYLIYGRFGYVRTNAELTFTSTAVPGSPSGDEDFDGFRFGGGVEGMFADNIGVRAEYTYTMYEDEDINIGGVPFNIDPDQHLFRIGVAYYF